MKISVFYDHIREAAEQSGKSMDEFFRKQLLLELKELKLKIKY